MPRPRLSLCMIARDSARTLRAALDSIGPWVDEMVVVDTGSADDTAAIAADCGARVGHFAWCDDFAAARNESLRLATGDWLFWMDSDDTIDAANGSALRALADAQHPPARLGFVVQVICPPAADAAEHGSAVVVDHVKLVRNDPRLRFTGRIHEQILPAIRKVGGEVRWTDIAVHHSGADTSPEGRRRKLSRDLHLLRLELAEHPDDSFALFNLGMTLLDGGQAEQALLQLSRSLVLSEPGEFACAEDPLAAGPGLHDAGSAGDRAEDLPGWAEGVPRRQGAAVSPRPCGASAGTPGRGGASLPCRVGAAGRAASDQRRCRHLRCEGVAQPGNAL